jgi:hypothetical protein
MHTMNRTIARFAALVMGSAALLGISVTTNAQSAAPASPPAGATAPLVCTTLPTPVAPTAPANIDAGSVGSSVVTMSVEAGVVVQLDSAGRPVRILTNYGGAPKCTGVGWVVLRAGATSGTLANLALINKTLAMTDLGGNWSTVTWHQIG